MFVNPRSLIPHPQNQAIYGHEDLSELEASIREHGCLEAIVVTPEYVVVSGHRRLRVALDLGLPEVPIRIQEFDSDNAVLEALLLANLYREKTKLQRHNEGEAWEQIEAQKAKARMLLGKSIYPVEVTSTGYAQGKTRDVVGGKLGISGKSYEQEKKVVATIRSSPPQIAEALNRVFEQSTEVALEVAKESPQMAVPIAQALNDNPRLSAFTAWQQVKREEQIAQKLRERIEAVPVLPDNPNYVLGNCLDILPTLPRESVKLLLTDPPYGIAFQSNHRVASEQLPTIAGDESMENALDLCNQMLQAIDGAMANDCHILLFCGWRFEPEFRKLLADHNYSLDASLVWVKENHSSGDLTGFAPQHERILHGRRGNAVISPRLSDVFILPCVEIPSNIVCF